MATDPAESAVRNYLASLSTPDAFRQEFVEHAKAWAEAQSITPGAFEQMGVPQEVLREAGLIEGIDEPATPPRPVTGDTSENGASPSAIRSLASVPERMPEEAAPSRPRQRSAAWRVRRSFCRLITGQTAIEGLRKVGLLP